jgi:hypothetical protein
MTDVVATEEDRRFTAYKVYVGDGNQQRADFVRNLSLSEVQDQQRFPLGAQQDLRGSFIWSYGINDGQLI